MDEYEDNPIEEVDAENWAAVIEANEQDEEEVYSNEWDVQPIIRGSGGVL